MISAYVIFLLMEEFEPIRQQNVLMKSAEPGGTRIGISAGLGLKSLEASNPQWPTRKLLD
jgi:hypothetical protein